MPQVSAPSAVAVAQSPLDSATGGRRCCCLVMHTHCPPAAFAPSQPTHRYNHSIPPELGACIPARGAAGDAALCVLVGNSRALWEPFLDACATDDLLESENPLDVYLQRAVCGSLESCVPG